MPSRVFSIKTKKGSIIAFTLILLSILLTAGLSVMTVSTLEQRSGLSTQKSVVAFQAADSGTERILKRVYIDNSPSISSVPLDGTMPEDATLQELAGNLDQVRPEVLCDTGTSSIRATNKVDPPYSFETTFLDSTGAKISCTDTTWRDKAVAITTKGFYREASRVLDLGLKPRPKCALGETVDDDEGNSYNVLPIGDQCWMDRNMQVGNWIPSSTPQIDNPGGNVVEYYCYDDDPDNCTDNHPNKPDGGLYTWDEAMQYKTAERSKGICPDNFHVPTDNEWYILENYLKNTGQTCDAGRTGFDCASAGTKLKPGGSSGFEGNLAGRYTIAGFAARGLDGHFSTSTRLGSDAYVREITFWSNQVSRNTRPVSSYGFSVRCVMD